MVEMSKLIILQGLPASGKTTKAKELSQPGKNIRVNRDLLREMLHFGFSLKNEDKVKRLEKMIIKDFLTKTNLDVIVDDTNLNKKTVKELVKIAEESKAEIEFIKIDTSLEECIKRDSMRDNPVGEGIIKMMHKNNPCDC